MQFCPRCAPWLIALAVLVSSVDIGVARRVGATEPASTATAPSPDHEYYELFRELVDTMDQIERNYVKDISRRELFDAAIHGMLSRLDIHSEYIGEDKIDDFKTAIENRFGGIGVQLAPDLTVATPLYGTPAYRAGIKAGDKILEVDGESTKDWDIRTAVQRLKGSPGTEITLRIGSPDGSERSVTLRREIVQLETVQGAKRKEDDRWDFLLPGEPRIGYIRIRAFGEETPADVRGALEELAKQKLQGLVLDLRFNPGGLLSSAIKVSDLFLTEGVIVSTRGRNTKSQEWRAKRPGTYEGFPMVVLVNRSSASASEIVSAALQDHGRAKIAGERTWGKGSVQNVVELEGRHTALKLTTSSYFRPSGKNIDRGRNAQEEDDWGVRPDDGLGLRLSERELIRLYTHLEQRDVIGRRGSGPADANDESDNASLRFQDRQLDKALQVLREQIPKSP